MGEIAGYSDFVGQTVSCVSHRQHDPFRFLVVFLLLTSTVPFQYCLGTEASLSCTTSKLFM